MAGTTERFPVTIFRFGSDTFALAADEQALSCTDAMLEELRPYMEEGKINVVPARIVGDLEVIAHDHNFDPSVALGRIAICKEVAPKAVSYIVDTKPL